MPLPDTSKNSPGRVGLSTRVHVTVQRPAAITAPAGLPTNGAIVHDRNRRRPWYTGLSRSLIENLLSSEELSRFRSQRSIRKPSPRQRWHDHLKSLMPSFPCLLCEYARWRVLQYSPELGHWHIPRCYGQICRRAINHEVRQECFQVPECLLRPVVPDHLLRDPEQLLRVRRCKDHRSSPPGCRPRLERNSGSFRRSTARAHRVRSRCIAAGTRSNVPSP